MRVQDEAALSRLRRNLGRSLVDLVRKNESGTPLPVTSREGYVVYRIGINDAELLLAIRERKQGAHMKYVYFDGTVKAPRMYECFLPSMRTERDE